MTNAKEFRLGNLFQENANGTIYYHEVTLDWLGAMLIDSYLIDPIPLTPEILEKVGFEKILLGKGLCYGLPFSRMLWDGEPLHEIVLIDFGKMEERSKGKYALAIREYDRDIQFGITIVEYIHQLQNLYFALTGEELEINIHVETQ